MAEKQDPNILNKELKPAAIIRSWAWLPSEGSGPGEKKIPPPPQVRPMSPFEAKSVTQMKSGWAERGKEVGWLQKGGLI